MKKQILALSLGLISVGVMAQKSELKAAEKALKKNDFAGVLSALNSISDISRAEDKYIPKYYFFKGQALAGKKDYKAASKTFNKLIAVENKLGKKKYSPKVQPIVSKMVQEVSQKAVDLYNKKKDYKAASEYFYLTYLLSPKDTSFAFNAAVSSTQAKDYNQALKYYTKLKDLGYTGIETQYLATNKTNGRVENLGSKTQRDLLVKSGQYSKPQDKRTDSKRATIVKNIAYILKDQGKIDEAIVALQEARKASPKDVNLVLAAADVYHKMNRMDKFGELMSEATSIDPNNPVLFYNLGVVNYGQGRVEDAKKYYRRAIKLKPDYSDAYMNMAVAILDKDKAIVEEMNKNLSNFKKYDKLALQQKEVYREALPFLEKADGLNRSVDTVRTLMNLYEVLEKKSKASEYRKIYKSMK